MVVAWSLYIWAIWAALVQSSGALSSRTRRKRGKRSAIPFEGSTSPTAATCTGEIDRSAAITSHTWPLWSQDAARGSRMQSVRMQPGPAACTQSGCSQGQPHAISQDAARGSRTQSAKMQPAAAACTQSGCSQGQPHALSQDAARGSRMQSVKMQPGAAACKPGRIRRQVTRDRARRAGGR